MGFPITLVLSETLSVFDLFSRALVIMRGIGDSLCLHGLSVSTDGEDSVNILAIPSPPSRFERGIVGLETFTIGNEGGGPPGNCQKGDSQHFSY